MSKNIDKTDILLYYQDIMVEYKLTNFPTIDFQLYLSKGMHISDFPMHTHDFTELTIVTSGSATHIVENEHYSMKKGDVIAIIPSFAHAHTNVDQLEHYNFMFDLNKLSLLDSELKHLLGFQEFFVTKPYYRYRHKYVSHLVLNDQQLHFVKTLCEMMCDEFEKQEESYKILIKIYFLNLIAFLSKVYEPVTSDYSNQFHKISQTASYIEKHYPEKITLSQLSKMVFLSERHYSRIFKQIYHMSPIEYHIDCRINNACLLIRSSNHTLTQIANICGFSDKSSFSKMFRKKMGVSPKKYRESIGELV